MPPTWAQKMAQDAGGEGFTKAARKKKNYDFDEFSKRDKDNPFSDDDAPPKAGSIRGRGRSSQPARAAPQHSALGAGGVKTLKSGRVLSRMSSHDPPPSRRAEPPPSRRPPPTIETVPPAKRPQASGGGPTWAQKMQELAGGGGFNKAARRRKDYDAAGKIISPDDDPFANQNDVNDMLAKIKSGNAEPQLTPSPTSSSQTRFDRPQERRARSPERPSRDNWEDPGPKREHAEFEARAPRAESNWERNEVSSKTRQNNGWDEPSRAESNWERSEVSSKTRQNNGWDEPSRAESNWERNEVSSKTRQNNGWEEPSRGRQEYTTHDDRSDPWKERNSRIEPDSDDRYSRSYRSSTYGENDRYQAQENSRQYDREPQQYRDTSSGFGGDRLSSRERAVMYDDAPPPPSSGAMISINKDVGWDDEPSPLRSMPYKDPRERRERPDPSRPPISLSKSNMAVTAPPSSSGWDQPLPVFDGSANFLPSEKGETRETLPESKLAATKAGMDQAPLPLEHWEAPVPERSESKQVRFPDPSSRAPNPGRNLGSHNGSASRGTTSNLEVVNSEERLGDSQRHFDQADVGSNERTEGPFAAYKQTAFYEPASQNHLGSSTRGEGTNSSSKQQRMDNPTLLVKLSMEDEQGPLKSNLTGNASQSSRHSNAAAAPQTMDFFRKESKDKSAKQAASIQASAVTQQRPETFEVGVAANEQHVELNLDELLGDLSPSAVHISSPNKEFWDSIPKTEEKLQSETSAQSNTAAKEKPSWTSILPASDSRASFSSAQKTKEEKSAQSSSPPKILDVTSVATHRSEPESSQNQKLSDTPVKAKSQNLSPSEEQNTLSASPEVKPLELNRMQKSLATEGSGGITDRTSASWEHVEKVSPETPNDSEAANKECVIKEMRKTDDQLLEEDPHIFKVKESMYKCTLCLVTIFDKGLMLDHMRGTYHVFKQGEDSELHRPPFGFEQGFSRSSSGLHSRRSSGSPRGHVAPYSRIGNRASGSLQHHPRPRTEVAAPPLPPPPVPRIFSDSNASIEWNTAFKSPTSTGSLPPEESYEDRPPVRDRSKARVLDVRAEIPLQKPKEDILNVVDIKGDHDTASEDKEKTEPQDFQLDDFMADLLAV